MKRRALLAVVVVLMAGGCSPGDADPQPTAIDYYGEMRKVDAFADATDAELDDLADSACELVDAAVDAGESSADAVDRVFAAAQGLGLSDADALSVSITIVGANCPIDISE